MQQLSPIGRSVIEDFVRQRTKTPDRFHLTVSPEDEMYLYHVSDAPEGDVDDWLLSYFESGSMMIEELRPIFDHVFGGFDKLDSLLEFACGHGRFTRFLVQELDPERISVSDIYADAVEFQRKEFGVRGIVSALEPSDYQDERRYDCILVCSLFSHLPERTFHLWLGKLLALLTDEGVLIFTVHDEAVGPAMGRSSAGHKKPRITFSPESESRSLDKHVYGTTFVNEAFCRRAIEKASKGLASYARKPKGLWRYQDVYVVSMANPERLASLNVAPGLEGFVERCDASEGRYILGGWAHDFRKGEEVELVELLKEGERVQVCIPAHDRPEVAAHYDDDTMIGSGWVCMVDESRLPDTSIVSVRITSSTGERRVIAFNSVARLFQRPVR